MIQAREAIADVIFLQGGFAAVVIGKRKHSFIFSIAQFRQGIKRIVQIPHRIVVAAGTMPRSNDNEQIKATNDRKYFIHTRPFAPNNPLARAVGDDGKTPMRGGKFTQYSFAFSGELCYTETDNRVVLTFGKK
ncbi:MAG: hypothetical protein IJB27_06040 [Clostridia bacterium]|nr:hypothetical protein [Clostridia bacterium]